VVGELREWLAGAGSGPPAGEPLVGTVVTVPDIGLAELTAGAADLVWIDLEHGALSVRDVLPLAIAARAAGAASLVRLRSSGDASLGPALDAGIDGVVVPRVESADEAEDVVTRLRYPPRGSRGLAARRASGYGVRPRGGRGRRIAAGGASGHSIAAGGTSGHSVAAGHSVGVGGGEVDPVCFVQIESAAAAGRAEVIAAVDGVDALVVGAADLAADMGDPLGPASPGMPEAIAAVRRACESAGIAFGVAGPADADFLLALAGPDARVLVLGADVRVYALAVTGALERLRHGPARDAPEPEEAHVGT
jgi:2-keto-3-deoxy-L-rhamnonate aldolase RhmA